MGDGLVQPHRPGRSPRPSGTASRRSRPSSSTTGSATRPTWTTGSGRRRTCRSTSSTRVPAGGVPHQRPEHPDHVGAQHVLRVVAHDRGRDHRGRPDHRPDQHQSLSYVFTETINVSGYGNGVVGFTHPTFWFVFGLGLLLSQYTITGFDASRTRRRRRTTRRAGPRSAWTSVVVSVIFGWILLLAVTFSIPSTEGRSRTSASSSPGSGPSR